ncbi:MAG: MFS transporter [Promethearchaeota archaeon]|jgi:MFS family permease
MPTDPIEGEKQIFSWINKQGIMWKFKFYGFFKNLKFFEPYLIIIFLAWEINLYQIGILIAIQEIITFIFEVPSGMLADTRGKKTELLFCFVFYIFSFIFYFMGPAYIFLMIGAMLFGLGEAFRSGTHKAMEMKWMEKNEILQYKSFVYGTTRSYSLYGSAISSILSIILILNIPASRWIFLITIIPYIIDFVLIATYPSYMNEHSPKKGSYWKDFLAAFKGLKIVVTDRRLRKGLLSMSFYDGIYKSLKDYIQPIIKLFIAIFLLDFALTSSPLEEEFFLTLILGLIYASFYLVSSYSTKKAYFIQKKVKSSKFAMDLIFYFFAFLILGEAILIWFQIPLFIIIFYLFIYIFYNMRRPIAIDFLGDIMNKDQRATILSVQVLLRSILIIIFAPLFGYIAEVFSIGVLFLWLGIFILFLNFFLLRGDYNAKKIESEIIQ